MCFQMFLSVVPFDFGLLSVVTFSKTKTKTKQTMSIIAWVASLIYRGKVKRKP